MVTQPPRQARSRNQTFPNDSPLRHEPEPHHHHCEQRLLALETLIDAKLTTLRTIIELQAEKSVTALAASDKAILKAEIAVEKRFESVNEFRQTLLDQTNTFISRVEFEALRDTNSSRIADLASRLDKIEGKAVGLNAGWIYLLGGLSAAGTVASIIAAILLNR
jgi:hypothetical protein